MLYFTVPFTVTSALRCLHQWKPPLVLLWDGNEVFPTVQHMKSCYSIGWKLVLIRDCKRYGSVKRACTVIAENRKGLASKMPQPMMFTCRLLLSTICHLNTLSEVHFFKNTHTHTNLAPLTSIQNIPAHSLSLLRSISECVAPYWKTLQFFQPVSQSR